MSSTLKSANAPTNAGSTEGPHSFSVGQTSQVAVEPRKGPGRPPTFDSEVFDDICNLIADGKTLLQICRIEGMPHASTVRRWIAVGTKELRDQYARSRALGLEVLADEIVEIADDSSGDVKTIETANGSYETLDREFAERSKIRIDARKWMLSKLAAHTYGDKIEQTITANTTTRFTLSVGDGSVQQRQEKQVESSATAPRMVFDLPAKSAQEIIEENL